MFSTWHGWWRDFKYLTRRTAFDKILHNKAFDIAENPKYHGYQRSLASVVYKFFDKETSDGATTLANLLLKMKIFQAKN